MSVIDVGTDTVIATIPVGILPIGIAITPDSLRALVANSSSNSVSIINTTTNTVVTTLPTGPGPQFIVINAIPTILSVNPSTGPQSGGTSVTITGFNFTGATSVLFGTTPALSFIVNSDSSITAISPPGTGTVDIRVITPFGISVIRAADRFTYQILSPTNFVGTILKNVFLNRSEIGLRATWTASPTSGVVAYRIYEGNTVIATIPASGPLIFVGVIHSTNNISITAVNAAGFESAHVPLTIVQRPCPC